MEDEFEDDDGQMGMSHSSNVHSLQTSDAVYERDIEDNYNDNSLSKLYTVL